MLGPHFKQWTGVSDGTTVIKIKFSFHCTRIHWISFFLIFVSSPLYPLRFHSIFFSFPLPLQLCFTLPKHKPEPIKIINSPPLTNPPYLQQVPMADPSSATLQTEWPQTHLPFLWFNLFFSFFFFFFSQQHTEHHKPTITTLKNTNYNLQDLNNTNWNPQIHNSQFLGADRRRALLQLLLCLWVWVWEKERENWMK